MEISTTTMAGKTGLQIEALIKEAYEQGERVFTSDLPLDIFDPALIGSTQWSGEGDPCTFWGFNVGEWDLVAASFSERKTIYTHREETKKVSTLISAHKLPYLGRSGNNDYYDVNGIVWEIWQRGCGNPPTSEGILTANFKLN